MNATVVYESPNDGVWSLLFQVGTGEDFGPHPIEHRHNGFLEIPPEKVEAELAGLAWRRCYQNSDNALIEDGYEEAY